MIQVFLSYSPCDKDKADQICDYLEQNRFCCLTCNVDELGENIYSEEFRATLDQCKLFVQILTIDSEKDPNTYGKLGSAFGHGIPIILVLWDDVDLSFDVPNVLYANLYDGEDKDMDCIYTLAKDILGLNSIVFISHSSKDYQQVKHYVDILEANGIPCWISPRDIPFGGNHADVIPQAIERSRCMLVFISDQAQSSIEIDREIRIASDNKIPIIPVKLESCKLRGCYQYHLINKQWFDTESASEEDYEKLFKNIKSY